MKRVLLSAAALALIAAPGAAQQSTQTSPSTSPSAQSSSSSGQMSQSGAGQQQHGQQQQRFSAQKIQQDLQKSGFQDVSVVDAAYLVHARTSDGNFVLMLVDPPGSPAATTGAGSSAQGQSGQQQAQSGQQHSQQQKMKENLTKAGFSNVTVIDAAYLVHAKTADGSAVRMTINPPSMGGDATTGSGMGGAGSGSQSGASPSGAGGQNR